jgi:hypothetical protein
MTRAEIENEALRAEVRRTRSQLEGLQSRIQRLIEELAADVQRHKEVVPDTGATWKTEWILHRLVAAMHDPDVETLLGEIASLRNQLEMVRAINDTQRVLLEEKNACPTNP